MQVAASRYPLLSQLVIETVLRIASRLRIEGHATRSGLIDRPALEAVLAGRARRGDTAIYRLSPLIDVESWARAWLGEP